MDTADGDELKPTDQELEVLRLIASGLNDVVVAHRLGISVVTVRRRMRSFRLRVGAASRSEAIAKAAALGWL